MNRFCGRLGKDGLRVYVPDEQVDGADVHAGCAVLFRGFLANEAALRGQLRLPAGLEGSEPAIAAHAYRRWRFDVQQRLLGEYALVLFDAATALPSSRTTVSASRRSSTRNGRASCCSPPTFST